MGSGLSDIPFCSSCSLFDLSPNRHENVGQPHPSLESAPCDEEMLKWQRQRATDLRNTFLCSSKPSALPIRDPMRPAEAVAWIQAKEDVPAEDLKRIVKNGTQSIFENDVHWARFYLVKAGLVGNARRGLWTLTTEGREKRLSQEETWDLYVRIRDAKKPGEPQAEEDVPAPGTGGENEEDGKSYWFAGSVWGGTDDQLPRFLDEGVWENGYDDKFLDLVRRIKPGDQIAIKASFVKKRVPFDAGGKPVSVMRIKATGTVLENLGDGRTVKVAWNPPSELRDWYFYTYRTTLVKADTETEDGRRLVDFAFRGAHQDYAWWLAQPYWLEKYGVKSETLSDLPAEPDAIDDEEIGEEVWPYAIEDIIAEGCFLTIGELEEILNRWRLKMNLILQGPPGTGKTWLAKRLGFALAGSNDRETAQSRLRVVQFHPSLAYEDFVRGWRPAGDGRLQLVDGIMMQAIQAAESEPDRPFVLVIEEINRGNPAQIFGEMLTLLEVSKRQRSEAIELAYRKVPGERIHVPENLYVIGTMNVADRSLAIVDLRAYDAALPSSTLNRDLETRGVHGAPTKALIPRCSEKSNPGSVHLMPRLLRPLRLVLSFGLGTHM